jgi:tetratricopeptide (TPR) repeat protein
MRFITRTALTVAVVLGVAWTAQAQWTWTPQTGRWVNLKRMPKETAELQIEHARSLMVQGDYKRALRETEKFVQFYAGDPLSDQNQFLRGEIRMAQGNWMDAAKEFQQVIAGYPNTSIARSRSGAPLTCTPWWWITSRLLPRPPRPSTRSGCATIPARSTRKRLTSTSA